MTPDSDIKDRILNPGQNTVLDAGYSSVYLDPAAESDDEGEDDGDSDDRASFALDTPEPAIPAMAGPELAGAKGKRKLRKSPKRPRSFSAVDFAKIAGEAGNAKIVSTAVTIDIDAAMFMAAHAETVSEEFFDQQTGLMNVLFAPGERPWEDETLSAAERMALMKVIRTNFPDAQKRAEREEFEYRIRARSWGRSANVAPVVAAVAKVEQSDAALVIKRRESPVVQNRVIEPLKEIRLAVPATPFIREYEPDKLNRKLNATLGMGAIIGMPSSLAMLNGKAKSRESKTPVHYLGLAELVANEIQAGNIQVREQEVAQAPVQKSWNPLILSRDNGFVAALNKIYHAIVPEILTNITPYRKAMWQDKILEQKENMSDITFVEAKLAAPAPAPSPFAEREVKMNISVPAFK